MMFLVAALGVYLAGVWTLRRSRNHLMMFLWGGFGLAFMLIQSVVFLGGDHLLAALQARHIQSLMGLMNNPIDVVNGTTMLVPHDRGWVGMVIGVESSTLIEMAVFSGIMLFYPGFTPRRRIAYALIGLIGTYLINLVRLLVIIYMVMILGRDTFHLAHAVVGRTLYFIGIIALYWYLLTRPTLGFIRDRIRVEEYSGS